MWYQPEVNEPQVQRRGIMKKAKKQSKPAKKNKKTKKISTRKPVAKKSLKQKPKQKGKKPTPKAKKTTAKKPIPKTKKPAVKKPLSKTKKTIVKKPVKQVKKIVKVKPKKITPKLKVKKIKPRVKKVLPVKKKALPRHKKIIAKKAKPAVVKPKLKVISVKVPPKKGVIQKQVIKKLPPQKPLTAEQIQYFRNILLKKKTDCENRLAKLEERMKHTQQEDSGDASTYPLHIGDIASDTEVKEQSSYIISSIVKELRRINKALERLDSGNYGYCENCGSSININRLNTIPYAELCIKCGEQLQGF